MKGIGKLIKISQKSFRENLCDKYLVQHIKKSVKRKMAGKCLNNQFASF